MKIELGPASLQLPADDSILPTLVLGVGVEDRQEPLSAGMTLVKSKTHTFKRSLSVSFNQVDGQQDSATLLQVGVNRIVEKMGAKVTKVNDSSVHGSPAKIVVFTYTGPDDVPLKTHALIVHSKQYVHTIMLSALNSRKNEKAVQAQFDSIVQSFEPKA